MLKDIERNLQQEVNELEQRNLQLMEVLYKNHKRELEVSHKLFAVPRQHSGLLFNTGETSTYNADLHSESKHPIQDKKVYLQSCFCYLQLNYYSYVAVT